MGGYALRLRTNNPIKISFLPFIRDVNLTFSRLLGLSYVVDLNIIFNDEEDYFSPEIDLIHRYDLYLFYSNFEYCTGGCLGFSECEYIDFYPEELRYSFELLEIKRRDDDANLVMYLSMMIAASFQLGSSEITDDSGSLFMKRENFDVKDIMSMALEYGHGLDFKGALKLFYSRI